MKKPAKKVLLMKEINIKQRQPATPMILIRSKLKIKFLGKKDHQKAKKEMMNMKKVMMGKGKEKIQKKVELQGSKEVIVVAIARTRKKRKRRP